MPQMPPADPFTCIQCGEVLPEGSSSNVCDDCAQELAEASAPWDEDEE